MIIIIIMMVMIIMREKQNKQTDKSYFKKNYKKQMNVALCRFCTASIPSLRSRHFPNQLTNPNSIRPESSNSQTRFPSPRPTHPLLPHPVGSSLNVCFVIGQWKTRNSESETKEVSAQFLPQKLSPPPISPPLVSLPLALIGRPITSNNKPPIGELHQLSWIVGVQAFYPASHRRSGNLPSTSAGNHSAKRFTSPRVVISEAGIAATQLH